MMIENFLSIFQENTSSAPETQQPTSPPASNKDSSFNLPSAPSNRIPPSYTLNPCDNAGYPSSAQSPYPHTSGTTPFDSLGGNDRVPGPQTIGTYSYPSDPPGFTPSPPPTYNSYSPAPQDRYHQDPAPQDPAQYHHQQQPHWPSSAFNDSASAYPSIFPGGYPKPAPPQVPNGASRHSDPPVRTSSAPVGAESSHLNGSCDSDYKPSAGQVVEAHKASRFAVSALAFDDVPTAISYLRKSLELLTSPSATERF